MNLNLPMDISRKTILINFLSCICCFHFQRACKIPAICSQESYAELLLWAYVPSTIICHAAYKINVFFLIVCSFLIHLLHVTSPFCPRFDDLTENQKEKLFSEHVNLLVGPYFDLLHCRLVATWEIIFLNEIFTLASEKNVKDDNQI